ncbi:uncharacterized protein LOC118439319 [Folsomia candida]|uniref:Uncharacterized protein n=1 Tax=Folsomia candida TaxID=158441 RepID=A0A226D5E3_FOLCA|nr:uncharacterized protein LOC118439319 [Folsomia candida]OXA40403.1 hypothetical protein Fcan01_24928 [Folsomia candida]
MAQTQGVRYKSVNWGKDRPAEGKYLPQDLKLTFETKKQKTDRYFTLRNRTTTKDDTCWIQVSFKKDVVYGKSKILDDFISSRNGNLFERPEYENLNELHFRRMLGVFYGYDMNYIEDEKDLVELYIIAKLFKAESVELFCSEKLARFQGRNAPGTTSSSDGDWVVLEKAEVNEKASTVSKTPDPQNLYGCSMEGVAFSCKKGSRPDGVQASQNPGKSRSSTSKTTMSSSIKAEILSNVITSLKPELIQELAADMKDQIKEIILEDLRSEIEDRLRSDDDLKDQLVSEVTEVLREETKQELMNDPDLKAELLADIRNEIVESHNFAERMIGELKQEFVPKLKDDIKSEIYDELKEKLKTMLLDDYDEGIRDAIVEEIRSGILDDAELKKEVFEEFDSK